MRRTSPAWRLAVTSATVTGMLAAAWAGPAWGQAGPTPRAGQAGQTMQSGQAEQPGQLEVPGGGSNQPQALPGQSTQPGQTGPLKEQAVQPGTGTPGTGGTAPGEVTDARLNTYIQVRQQLERDDPSMQRAFETGDFSGRMDNIRSALRGSQMSPEEFVQLHQQVQSDPNLESRVEAQLGRTPSGTPTSGAGTGVPHPAGGAEAPALSNETAPSGAAPGANQQ